MTCYSLLAPARKVLVLEAYVRLQGQGAREHWFFSRDHARYVRVLAAYDRYLASVTDAC